ncbi:MAG: cyclodeaminase/cyclohydrolase family protein [Halodesulfurarchaeum sp.]
MKWMGTKLQSGGFEIMDYSTHEIGQFLEAVASTRVAPAGGSAAALTGAFGAALAEMAALHTRERGGDTDSGELTLARERLSRKRSVLLTLATEDAQAIDALFGAQTGDPDAGAVSRATGIPLSIAEACVTVLEEALDLAELIDGSVRQDLHTALYLTVSAAWAAIRTVEPNLDLLEEGEIRTELEARADRAAERVSAAMDRFGETTGEDCFG